MGPGLGAWLVCSSLPHRAHDWAPEPQGQSTPTRPQQQPAGLQRERAQRDGTRDRKNLGAGPAPPHSRFHFCCFAFGLGTPDGI